MKTYTPKGSTISRQWHLVDLNGQVLGRAACLIAQKLIGKKVNYTPHLDGGDYVVAINAAGIKVTGNKADKKIYYHHTGYPGGLRSYTYRQLMVKDPTRLVKRAVKNMLPKNKLRKNRLTRLRIFVDGNHPYENMLKAKSKKSKVKKK